MLSINNKIRNDIANNYRLRQLAKDSTLSKEKTDELYTEVSNINKRIIFLKKLEKELKEQNNDKQINKRL